jgi:hypothetical protein
MSLFVSLVGSGCSAPVPAADKEAANAALGPTDWDCQSDEEFFTTVAWPQVFSICVACHEAGGQSGNTRFVLVNDTTPDAVQTNLARLKDVSALKQDGVPLLLLKPTAAVTHGGGERIKKGSTEYAIVKALISRFDHPPTCQVQSPVPQTQPVPPLDALSADQTFAYLNKIAPQLVERFASPNEMAIVEEKKGLAIPDVLQSFTEDEHLEDAARRLVEKLLTASGNRGDIDFELPGNLAAHLVRAARPWKEILTAQSCYDSLDRAIPCDTGAPFTGGVLVTRAYLTSRASRFNLTRSSTLMGGFGCFTYPIADEYQPHIEKSRLIPMFQAMSPEEQTDPRAKSGFGNGFGCYMCHGQFSLHAQLFVKFDRQGNYRPEATGIQDPNGELGTSTPQLMASHLQNPDEAKSEASAMMGTPVANLAEAGAVLANSSVFLPCAARKIIDATVGTDASTTIDKALLARIADAATKRAKNGDATFADLVIATFSDPVVVHSVLTSGSADTSGGTP